MKIITADHVLPVSSPPISGGAVAFEQDRIVAVGTAGEIAGRYPEATREDLGNAAVLPGLVNVHSHLELTALRGFADEFDHDFHNWLIRITTTRGERLDDTDVKLSALAGAVEGAIAGVTCFGDIGRLGSAGAAALSEVGLRGVVFQETEFSPDDRTAADDFNALIEKFRTLQAIGTDRVEIGISPHAPYTVSAELFRRIADFARSERVKLSIHASESLMEEDLMLYGTGFFAGVYEKFGFEFKSPGVSTIEYLDSLEVLAARPLLAHCVRVSDDDIGRIADSDSRVAHCPKSNAKFGHGAAPLERLLSKGIKVGFGSDSMASNNTCDLFEEARFGALLARASGTSSRFLQPHELIGTATLGGARALGLDDRIGTLDAGKDADLIAVSLDRVAQMPVHDVNSALVFASNASDVVLTVVAGREVARNGRTTGVADDDIASQMAVLAEKMRIGSD